MQSRVAAKPYLYDVARQSSEVLRLASRVSDFLDKQNLSRTWSRNIGQKQGGRELRELLHALNIRMCKDPVLIPTFSIIGSKGSKKYKFDIIKTICCLRFLYFKEFELIKNLEA